MASVVTKATITNAHRTAMSRTFNDTSSPRCRCWPRRATRERTFSSVARRAEHVSNAAHGVDQMRLGEIDLFAGVDDVGLEHTGVAAEVVVPDVVEELGSGEHTTRVREQVAKQPVFGCRQVDELDRKSTRLNS